MLTIIHGEDIVTSRKFYLSIKEQDGKNVSLDGEKMTLTDLIQAAGGSDLFSSSGGIFIELLLSKRKTGKELDAIKEQIQKSAKDTDIYLWEGKEIDKRSIVFWKEASCKNFHYPKTLFVFLDSIKPKNHKIMLTLFKDLLKTNQEEIVFFMLIRQFRLLLALREETEEAIEEVKRLAPWQRGKLERQAKAFSSSELKAIYQKLFELDLAQKTGTLLTPLSSAIDFLLLEI